MRNKGKHINKLILPAIVGSLIFFSLSLKAQSYSEERRGFFSNWRLNFNAGLNLFYGDIKQYRYLPMNDDYRVAYGAVLKKQFSPVFGIGFQLLNGKLHSSRRNFAGGDKMFDADILEGNMQASINFSNLLAGFNPNRTVSIYGFAGVGLASWYTQLYNNGKPIRTSGASKSLGDRTTEGVVPLGLGLKFNINDNIGLNLESSLRTVNSDKLDAWVSGFKYDFYNYNSFGFYYNLNSLARRDPARQQARYDRRVARESYREVEDYEADLDERKSERLSGREEDYKGSYRRAQSYRDQQRAYSEAEEDLKYYNKKTKEDQINPNRFRYDIKRQQEEGLKQFWEEHARGELPEVVEYDIMGVYSRLSEDEQPQQSPSPETDVMLIDTEDFQDNEGPTRVLTENPGSRTLTDEPSAVTGNQYAGVVFRVQILAKTTGRADTDEMARKYGIVKSIDEDYSNGTYRYVVGAYKTYQEANLYAKTLRGNGIYDAFVVAYKNGIRIPVASLID